MKTILRMPALARPRLLAFIIVPCVAALACSNPGGVEPGPTPEPEPTEKVAGGSEPVEPKVSVPEPPVDPAPVAPAVPDPVASGGVGTAPSVTEAPTPDAPEVVKSDALPIVDPPVEPEKPANPEKPAVEAPPVVMLVERNTLPEEGSDAWNELVKNADMAALLRLVEAKAAATSECGHGMAAAGALLGMASSHGPTHSPELERGDGVVMKLAQLPEINRFPIWLATARGLAAHQYGVPREALQHLTEAYRLAMREVEPELDSMRFTSSDAKVDDAGQYEMRKTPDGVMNDVFRPTDDIWVAQTFRFLDGVHQPTTGRYHYKIRVSAELLDEKAVAVPNFSAPAQDLSFTSKSTPDQWEIARQRYRLPFDIKSEQDYTLRITITDLQDEHRRGATRDIRVKVRNR